MKVLRKSVAISLLISIFSCAAIGATLAQVVAEDPNGATITRGGSNLNLQPGNILQEGDVIKSNAATVVISICDGALVTLYPKSELAVVSLSADVATVNLMKGELLGDTITGCAISVDNKVGRADISNGVYGVLLNETGEGWTLQVRNLDGKVTFTGGEKLDTSNMTVSLVEPGKSLPIPAGEEIIVRGIYDRSTEIFTLVTGGAAIAMLPDSTIGTMRDDASTMASIGRDDEDDDDDGEDPDPDEVFIPIPLEDIETASDKG
ncbi:MAG: hypothetical protein AB3N63_19610 [Puniceicoccaceae bacterium]